MRPALGKGLNALMSDETVASVAATPAIIKGEPMRLPVASIQANPLQPRKRFSEESLEELANSIRVHGVLQPILVQKIDGKDGYEIIAGERRWRAAQRAGLSEIPALLKSGNPADHFEIALIENIQRADLNPMELARGYKRLQEEFGLTQEAIATAVGKDRAVVANTLRLISLAPEIQQALEEEKLSAAHARTLAGLDQPADQMALFQKILSDGLTVRDVEVAVRTKKQVKVREHLRTSGQEPKAPEVTAIEEDLQRSLTRKVEVQETDKKAHRGWLKLEFYSPQDLEALIARLKQQ